MFLAKHLFSAAVPRKSPEGCSACWLNTFQVIIEKTPLVPSVISHYEIFEKLGEGGMAARIKTKPNFQSENPEKLFSAEAAGVELERGYSFGYAVTSDGKNIFAVKGLGESNRPNLVLVENWIEEFKDKK